MKRIRLRGKSSIFYKVYTINILIIIFCIGTIAFMSSKYSSKFIIDSMVDFNKQLSQEKVASLDENIHQLQEIANIVVEQTNTFKFILEDDISGVSSMEVLSIIRHLNNVCSNNSLIQGIKLIDVNNDIIITNKTKYQLNEVFEQQDLEKMKTSSFADGFLASDDEATKISYIKTFQPIKGKKILVVLDIDQQVFLKNILLDESNQIIKNYIAIDSDKIVYPLNIELEEQNLVYQILEENSEDLKTNPHYKDKIVYRNTSKISNVSIVWIQDYSLLVKNAHIVTGKIIVASVLILIIATILIYFGCLYFYSPLKKLTNKVQKLTVFKPSNIGNNEYLLIEEMVDKLQREKEKVFQQYNDAIPFLVNKMIYKLITDPVFDEKLFQNLLILSEKEMPYKNYIVVILEKDEDILIDNTKEIISAILDEQYLITGVSTEWSSSMMLLLINTELDYVDFINVIQEIKDDIQKTDDEITWCISEEFQNINQIHHIYRKTLSNLENKFFKGKNTLIYDEDKVGDKKATYFKEIERKLVNYVSSSDLENAIKVIKDLTAELTKNNIDANIKYICYMYFKICNNLLQYTFEAGAKIPKAYNEEQIFAKIFEADTIHELEEIAKEIIMICTEYFNQEEKGYSKSIEAAIQFISSNYMNDLSLEDVGNAVFLSPGYLSNIFKEETGFTILEYMTYTRMEVSKKLLLETPTMKVKDVSEQVGYNNVQSFIRYFKKYYGVTPATFRKEMLNQDK